MMPAGMMPAGMMFVNRLVKLTWTLLWSEHVTDSFLGFQELNSLRRHVLSIIAMGNAAVDSRYAQLDWAKLQNAANVVVEKAMCLFVMSSLPICNKGEQHVLKKCVLVQMVCLHTASRT